MNNRIALAFIITMCATELSLAIDTLQTSISDILLYRQGATVERRGDINLTAGYNRVLIANLPSGLDRSSLSTYTSNGVIILSQKMLNTNEPSSAMRALHLQKQALQDSMDWINTKMEILKNQNDLLNKNKRLPEETSEQIDLEVSKLHYNYGRIRLENEKKILQLKGHIRPLEQSMKKLDNEIHTLSRTHSNHAYLELELQTTTDRNTTIKIEYTLSNAGWNPAYDIRVNDLREDMNLIYKASVYQNTGEDWENAKVTLSTALPQRYYDVPQLHPYYLNEEIYPAPMRAKKNIDYAANGAVIEEVAEEEVVDQYAPSNELTTMTTSVEYKLSHPLTLSSGGGSATLLLRQENVAAKYEYVAIPKARQYAMLTAKISEWSSLDLLGGQAQIYLDGRRIGNTYIQPSAEDTYTLSLGEDRKVRLKRELQKGYEKTKAWSGGKVDTRQWKLTVQNQKTIPITITIKDQYPISQNSDIKVKLIEDGEASADNVKGELSWQTEIGANKSWTRTIKYEVKYPKGRRIYVD